MGKVECRSNYNKGSFKDDEINSGEEITDQSQAMDMKTIIERVKNGQPINGSKRIYYEVNGKMSDEQALETIDITQNGDFDLADIPRIQEEERIAKENLEFVKNKIKKQKDKDREKQEKAKLKAEAKVELERANKSKANNEPENETEPSNEN